VLSSVYVLVPGGVEVNSVLPCCSHVLFVPYSSSSYAWSVFGLLCYVCVFSG
jgi:hypothetical protein